VVLQRAIESAGIPTVLVASLPIVAEQLGAPRIAATDTPMGAPLGAPRDVAQQTRILLRSLKLLETATEPGKAADLGESYHP
jgi:hypothetical protein